MCARYPGKPLAGGALRTRACKVTKTNKETRLLLAFQLSGVRYSCSRNIPTQRFVPWYLMTVRLRSTLEPLVASLPHGRV